MYKPVPPRPKKTDNVRSRMGCQSCRERRTKCDEKKPTCGTCARLRKVCQKMRPQLKFCVATTSLPKPQPADTSVEESRLLATKEDDNNRRSPSRFVSSLNLRLIQSLQHTERDVFYTTHCENRCMPALHSIFRQAFLRFGGLSMLKDAILALSSCNISRSNAEYKTSPSVDCLGALRPSLVHQTRSQLYYSRAIKSFTSLSDEDCQKRLPAVLAVVVIFAYIETSIGNFTGLECHVRGLSIFKDAFQGRIDDRFIQLILTAWMQPRFLSWWSRAYYSSIDVLQTLPQILLPTFLHSSFSSFEERRVLVLHIMCESHRLNLKAALSHWTLSNTSKEPDTVNRNDNIEEVYALLAAESRRLDEWLSQLPPSEQPFTRGAMHESTSIASDTAIHFQSHDAALNYAYYVVARIMQCTDYVWRLSSRDPSFLGHEFSDAEPWIRLLLDIAQGSDMRTSVLRNTYTIGFSSLLLAAFLRCQDIVLSALIEEWLQALEDLTPTEEGSFPIFQALSVVRAINRQRTIGRDVFAVSQPFDDVGGPKFSCYCSQSISSLLMHGKIRNTGKFFTEQVPIGRQWAARRSVNPLVG